MTGDFGEMDCMDLQHTEIDWRRIIETAMDGIVCINEQQRIIFFNTAAEAIFGYRHQDVIGKPITMLIPERFRTNHPAHVERFGNGPVQHRRMDSQRTVLALRSNDEEFPVEASISHNTMNGRKVYTAIFRDVTQNVLQKARIHEQLQMLEQVSDAIMALDLRGRIKYWNRAAEQMFGWKSPEVLGKSAVDVLYRGTPQYLDRLESELRAESSWTGEVKKVRRNGSAILVEHRQTPLIDETGSRCGYLCVNIDVTDRRKREQVQRRSQRLESIGTLAGGIAHDLNNVLTPILMGSKLLRAGRTANVDSLLQTMVASAERGTALIQQLLKFAGGVRGNQSIQRIAELVAETRGILEHTLPKSIRIETHMHPNLPEVMGDATELTQVLMNLCINARDAMPDGGVLTIDANPVVLNGSSGRLHPDAHPGEYVVIKVSDTGIGMTSEVLERIFDPFFTTKEPGRGTGLGLATVQGIVKAHGGFITVYSESGRGSTFSFYLPSTISTTIVDVCVDSHAANEGQNRKILLVDDEVAILQMTGVALESAGYQVLKAQNGNEAVASYKAHHGEISAVLLDMMMPGMNGLQVLNEIKKIDPSVIAIACSGLQTSDRESAALQHGARAFVAKPYSDHQILSVLATQLRCHQDSASTDADSTAITRDEPRTS